MTIQDVAWCIDTLKREEEILCVLRQQCRRVGDQEAARTYHTMARQLFAVRQLLEAEHKQRGGG